MSGELRVDNNDTGGLMVPERDVRDEEVEAGSF